MYAHNRDKHVTMLGILLHAGGVITLVISGWGFHYVVSSSIARQRQRNSSETVRLERVLKTSDATQAKYKQLSMNLAALERDAENMRQRIPDQQKDSEFLRDVAQAAEDEKLKIRNWQSGEWREKATHTEFEIRLSCEGEYKAICGFLDRLENLPRVATVQQLNVTAPDQENPYPFDMTLLLYFGARTPEKKES